MSVLSTTRHFQNLLFSGSHTYMNSPSNRITLAQEDDTDVDHLDLRFPECAGRSGTYYRRVLKIRIPINKMTFYWNGPKSHTPDIVVKVDSSYAQYLVRNDEDGKFIEVTHPEFPDAEPSYVVKAFLKDASFVEHGVFVLRESTTPRDLPKIFQEIQGLGGKVVLVGSGGRDNDDALRALCNVNLDPRKYFDYWHQIDLDRQERQRNFGVLKLSAKAVPPPLEPDVQPPVLPLSLIQRAQDKLRNSKTAKDWDNYSDVSTPVNTDENNNVEIKQEKRGSENSGSPQSPTDTSAYLSTRTKSKNNRRGGRGKRSKENKDLQNGKHTTDPKYVKPGNRGSPVSPKMGTNQSIAEVTTPLKSSLKKQAESPETANGNSSGSTGSSGSSGQRKRVTWSKLATSYAEYNTEGRRGRAGTEVVEKTVRINFAKNKKAERQAMKRKENAEKQESLQNAENEATKTTDASPTIHKNKATPASNAITVLDCELTEGANTKSILPLQTPIAASASPAVDPTGGNTDTENSQANRAVDSVESGTNNLPIASGLPKQGQNANTGPDASHVAIGKSTLSFAQVAKQAPPVHRGGPSTIFTPAPFPVMQPALAAPVASNPNAGTMTHGSAPQAFKPGFNGRDGGSHHGGGYRGRVFRGRGGGRGGRGRGDQNHR